MRLMIIPPSTLPNCSGKKKIWIHPVHHRALPRYLPHSLSFPPNAIAVQSKNRNRLKKRKIKQKRLHRPYLDIHYFE